jgi:hypothetical protein
MSRAITEFSKVSTRELVARSESQTVASYRELRNMKNEFGDKIMKKI